MQCMQFTNMYFGISLKNYCPYCHQIFYVPRGHKGHLHVKILGGSDEGIFRGEGRNFFSIPYISLRWGRGTPKFYRTLGPWRALMSDT